MSPNSDSTYQDPSVRRQTTQSYLEVIDWTDRSQVARVLKVFERMLDNFEPESTDKIRRSLRQDGYVVTETNLIISPGPQLSVGSPRPLTDPAAIVEGLERIRRAIHDDPALAVGSAKELVESTAKVVLTERGEPFSERNDDLPALVSKAQRALGLHPQSQAAGPDTTDAVKPGLPARLGGLVRF